MSLIAAAADDWIPILCRRLRMRTVFLAEAKMFASTDLSSAVA